jgi:hypothetical protein
LGPEQSGLEVGPAARRSTAMAVYNPGIHLHLLDLGFEYAHMPEDWHDEGDAESGPYLVGGPAYDLYSHVAWDTEIAVESNGDVHVMEHAPGTLAYIEGMTGEVIEEA